MQKHAKRLEKELLEGLYRAQHSPDMNEEFCEMLVSFLALALVLRNKRADCTDVTQKRAEDVASCIIDAITTTPSRLH